MASTSEVDPKSWEKLEDDKGRDAPAQDPNGSGTPEKVGEMAIEYVSARPTKRPKKPLGWDEGLGRDEIYEWYEYTGPEEIMESGQEGWTESTKDFYFAPATIGGTLVFNTDSFDTIIFAEPSVETEEAKKEAKREMEKTREALRMSPRDRSLREGKDEVGEKKKTENKDKEKSSEEHKEEATPKHEKDDGRGGVPKESLEILKGIYSRMGHAWAKALADGKSEEDALAEARNVRDEANISQVLESASPEQYEGIQKSITMEFNKVAGNHKDQVGKAVSALLPQKKKSEKPEEPKDNKGKGTPRKATVSHPEIPADMAGPERPFVAITDWNPESQDFYAVPTKVPKKVLDILTSVERQNENVPYKYDGKYFNWRYVDEALAAKERKEQEKQGIPVTAVPRIWVQRKEPWKAIQDKPLAKAKAA